MLMADALAVCAEEGRVYEHDINDEPSNRRHSRWFPNGAIPFVVMQRTFRFIGLWEPGELKHLSNPRKRNHMRFP